MGTENALEKHVGAKLLDAIGRNRKQIEKVLARAIDPDRFMRLIVGEINRTPDLLQCTPASVLNAVVTAASLGLEIRPRSAYLIPFRNTRKGGRLECTLLIDYRGKAALARSSGAVLDIDAAVVYSKDKFRYWRHDSGRMTVEHEPVTCLPGDGGNLLPLTEEGQRGTPIGAYAVAIMPQGPPKYIFLPWLDIEKHRARSRAKDTGPWVTDAPAMAMKTAVHVLCNLLPDQSEDKQLSRAQEIETAELAGMPMESVIDIEADDEKPILEQSAQAAAEIVRRKLAEPQPQPIDMTEFPDAMQHPAGALIRVGGQVYTQNEARSAWVKVEAVAEPVTESAAPAPKPLPPPLRLTKR